MREKEKGAVISIVLIIVLLIGALLAAGYFFFLRPRLQLEKARTPDTSLQTESIIPKGKIVESGMNAEIEIAPSLDKVISGDVTITANDVPEEAGVVGFALTEKMEDLGTGGIFLGFDSSPKGGWTKTFDTTEYDNGKYYIHVLVAEEIGSDPIGAASVRVEIKN